MSDIEKKDEKEIKKNTITFNLIIQKLFMKNEETIVNNKK
jgi:hypothetical protein